MENGNLSYTHKNYLIETIDRLAMHKMNVLHLHLVDDQGWRMEIKKYPKLTEVGAFRVDQENIIWSARLPVSSLDKGTYGGYLTQEDLKELVKYAQLKNVEIIPEIEMPAHVSSAIASYPELSCFEDPIGVPSGSVWPITDIYCAGKESTFEFLENVLDEVIDVFPSRYIHIGGDEATKINWEKCPNCQKRMRTENLKNPHELQSYFVKRIEKYINSKGKKLVGWDEILEGGLAPDATVMSWRGVKGGIEAAKQGHDVVMTPNTHCYFDHHQGHQNEEPLAIGGYTPISKVYEFDPIIDSMTVAETKHILGGQANLWAEYIPNNSQSEYMIYPRLAAMAEVLWSPKELRDWNDFSSRITTMFERYKELDINYAKSIYLVNPTTEVDLDKKEVYLSLINEFSNSDIRYVLGNQNINENAIKYTKPLGFKETTIVKASLFKNNKPIGKIFLDTIKFHNAVACKVNYISPYDDNYKGAEALGLVNLIRGTKNHHDGQWQAWLKKDMEVIIDLENEKTIKEVTMGSIENQGRNIYFPNTIEVYASTDGVNYTKIAKTEHFFAINPISELKDFKMSFEKTTARFLKISATNIKTTPKGTDAWLFVDEILVN
ncbi:glycoside hydrolase family 20 protein [Mariniflexile sp.]|uniref:glycoside hydrolase family 20 protein n=2 Tax=Mariniflexile sp. TaxID=1979402 RepID=UPI0040483B95